MTSDLCEYARFQWFVPKAFHHNILVRSLEGIGLVRWKYRWGRVLWRYTHNANTDEEYSTEHVEVHCCTWLVTMKTTNMHVLCDMTTTKNDALFSVSGMNCTRRNWQMTAKRKFPAKWRITGRMMIPVHLKWTLLFSSCTRFVSPAVLRAII